MGSWLLISLTASTITCPQVITQTDFNLSEYVRSSWYVHAQQPTSYLPVENNYCVVATYDVADKDKNQISVYNYARRKSVDGKNVNARNMRLCASVNSCFNPSKLEVNLCWLPKFFAGPYWVLAAGPSPAKYTWAIVSAGQPTERLLKRGNDRRICGSSGLWLFSRSPQRNQTQIDMQLSLIRALGVRTDLLMPVIQKDCAYSDMYIKP